MSSVSFWASDFSGDQVVRIAAEEGDTVASRTTSVLEMLGLPIRVAYDPEGFARDGHLEPEGPIPYTWRNDSSGMGLLEADRLLDVIRPDDVVVIAPAITAGKGR